jgi:hypothetical protein
VRECAGAVGQAEAVPDLAEPDKPASQGGGHGGGTAAMCKLKETAEGEVRHRKAGGCGALRCRAARFAFDRAAWL